MKPHVSDCCASRSRLDYLACRTTADRNGNPIQMIFRTSKSEKNRKCSARTDHVPERNSDVVIWHATHGLVPGAGLVSGVCANCQIEKTILRIKATKTATS